MNVPTKVTLNGVDLDNPNSTPLKTKPEVTFKNLLSVCKALFFGEGVSQERREKRALICSQCEYLAYDPQIRDPHCGICGCKISGDARIINLLRYEETPSYGCKHPGGSRWIKEGV
jgi:hypothetical protein